LEPGTHAGNPRQSFAFIKEKATREGGFFFYIAVILRGQNGVLRAKDLARIAEFAG
jgi:hypothetical protein